MRITAMQTKLEHLLAKCRGKEPLVATFLSLIVCVAAYSNYLWGNSIFVFSDVASDSMNQFLPFYTLASREMLNNGISFYTFNHLIGSNLYTLWPAQVFDPFNFLLYLTGDLLPQAIIYIYILRVLLTSLISSLWFKKLGHLPFTCVIMPVLYSFTGDLILRSNWYHHTVDGLLFALLFLAYEKYYQDKNWLLLPVAGLLIVLMRPIYYPYLYGLVLVGYAVARYIYDNGPHLKKMAQIVVKSCLATILGYGLGCFGLIPIMVHSMSSGRAGVISDNLLRIRDLKELLTAFFSLFSPIIMGFLDPNSVGIGNQWHFRGFFNVLEAPAFYCGIFTLFLIFCSICFRRKRQRSVFITLIVLFIAYMLFPLIHQVFSGPTEIFYKTSSFIFPIIFIYIAGYGMDDMLQSRSFLKIPAYLFASLHILLVFAVIGSNILGKSMTNNNVLALVLLMAVMYFIIIKSWNINEIRRVLLVALTFLVMFESASFSYIYNNIGRAPIAKDMEGANDLYWDGTKQASEFIAESDSSFYRINRHKNLQVFGSSVLWGYNGVGSYDSFVINEQRDFFMGVIPGDTALRSFQIPADRGMLNNLFSVKYALVYDTTYADYKRESPHVPAVPDYLEYVTTVDGVEIWENPSFLPLGVFYSSYIDPDDYEALNARQKEIALGAAFVPENGDYPSLNKISKEEIPRITVGFDLSQIWATNIALDSETNLSEELVRVIYAADTDLRESFTYQATSGDPSIFLIPSIPIPANTMVSLEIRGSMDRSSIDETEEDDFLQVFWGDTETLSEENSIRVPFSNQLVAYRFPFYSDSPITCIRIDFGETKNMTYIIEKINCTAYSAEAEEFAQNSLEALRQTPFNITSFSDSHIVGDIDLSQPGVLFFSFPYESGWSAVVDGSPEKLQKINIGFNGLALEPGFHTIELKYVPPGLKIGCYISIASVMVYAVFAAIWIKCRKLGRE